PGCQWQRDPDYSPADTARAAGHREDGVVSAPGPRPERGRTNRRRLAMTLVQQAGRSCGAWDACCTALEVKERLHKPAGEGCKHLRAEGGSCIIYHYRPKECADFFCAWRVDLRLEEEERPDRLGVVLKLRTHGDLIFFSAHEVQPGAFE